VSAVLALAKGTAQASSHAPRVESKTGFFITVRGGCGTSSAKMGKKENSQASVQMRYIHDDCMVITIPPCD
jgi:hypothetical protein